MIRYEFLTIINDIDKFNQDDIDRAWDKYDLEKNKCEDLGIISDMDRPVFHDKAFTPIFIDLKIVAYFNKSWVEYNGERIECVNCTAYNGSKIPPLIISYRKFKNIYLYEDNREDREVE